MLESLDVIYSEEINPALELDSIECKLFGIGLEMDISILRKEKRAESINFWRDVTELRSELRELLEQYETEKRIKDMFHSLGGKL